MHIFTAYILPILMFGLFMLYLELTMSSYGGPPLVLTVFFTLLIFPSALYSTITNGGDHALAIFAGSMVIALLVVGFMVYRYEQNKKKQHKPNEQDKQHGQNQKTNSFHGRFWH